MLDRTGNGGRGDPAHQMLDLDLIIVEIFTRREIGWQSQYPTQYLDKEDLPNIIKAVVRKGGRARSVATMSRHIESAFKHAEERRWGPEGRKCMP